MKRHRILTGFIVGVLASISLLMAAGAANAAVHSLSFSGEVFNYSGGVLSSTNSTVLLSYDHSPVTVGTPYTLDLTGTLSGGGNANGLLTNMVFTFKDGGGNTVFTGSEAGPAEFHIVGNSAAILGNYIGNSTNPIPGLDPGGSFSIGLSGWNGITTSGSGSGGTFTTAVPEAGSSTAMALLVVGGCIVGVRNRRR